MSTKIHALVDALGYAVGFSLTGGEEHDLVDADHLLSTRPDILIADKAYDAVQRVLAPLAAASKTALSPPRPTGANVVYSTGICTGNALSVGAARGSDLGHYSIEPNEAGDALDCSQEVARGLVVARGDCTKLVEATRSGRVG